MYWNTHNNSLPLLDPTYGISNVSGEYIDKKLYCQFTREALTSIQDPSSYSNHSPMDFDMNTQPYYFLMASGPVSQKGRVTWYFSVSWTQEIWEKMYVFDIGFKDPYSGSSILQ